MVPAMGYRPRIRRLVTKEPTVTWYAQTPARRARQIAADLLVLAWLAGCLLAGRLVHGVVLRLADPAYGLRDAAHRVDDGLTQTRGRLGDVPLVGDRLRGALEPLTGATGDVDRSALDFIAAVERLALVAGLITTILPLVVVVIPWLWGRLAFARRAASARAAATSPGLDLLALRALVRQSPPALARIGEDPAEGWRRGDPTVIQRLAALELAAAGVRLPQGRGSGAPG